MGAFFVVDIIFEKEKDRKKFEKKYKPSILVDENSNSFGFGAWMIARNPILNPIYFLGFMGYEDVKEIVKECKKDEIGITFFAFISINDYNSNWTKIKGRW